MHETLFYVVQLIPDLAPQRVKFGITTNLATRVRHYQVACPTAQVLRSWPLPDAWEAPMIAHLTSLAPCTSVSTETFDCQDLPKLIEEADRFVEAWAAAETSEQRYRLFRVFAVPKPLEAESANVSDGNHTIKKVRISIDPAHSLTISLRLRLAEEAQTQGVTIAELARRAGLTRGVVERYWKNRTTTISLDALASLAEALNVPAAAPRPRGTVRARPVPSSPTRGTGSVPGAPGSPRVAGAAHPG